MLARGDDVLACVSGGPDSVCLLEALVSLRESFGLKISVCHLDHMLRGSESREDAEFAREAARKHNLPFFSARKNVRLHASRKKLSVEEAARKIRYGFFLETARKFGQNKIAVGHNLDDQAETVLLNLFRGAGLAGIAGMPPVRELGGSGVFIIRPLIEIPRDEIEAYLDGRNIPSREDSSNLEPVYRRNRVRLELIPHIEENFAPDIRVKLARTAEIMRRHMEDFALSGSAGINSLIRTSGGGASIRVSDLKTLAPAAGRLLLQRAFNIAEKGETALSFNQADLLTGMALSSRPNARVDLPSGIAAVREYGAIIFAPAAPPPGPETSEEVLAPGVFPLPGLKLRLECSVFPAGSRVPEGAVLDYDSVKFPLRIRGRKKGDRFSPLGMDGTKKLKDFLIDRKIPFRERRNAAVLTGSGGGILALILPETGLIAISHKSRITAGTKRVLQLKIV